MKQVVDFLLGIWDYFAANILTQPAFLIGFIVLLGYILLKKPLYESIAGF
ncbi:PTS transporter subunit IIC [Enterococcus termitis]